MYVVLVKKEVLYMGEDGPEALRIQLVNQDRGASVHEVNDLTEVQNLLHKDPSGVSGESSEKIYRAVDDLLTSLSNATEDFAVVADEFGEQLQNHAKSLAFKGQTISRDVANLIGQGLVDFGNILKSDGK